MVNNAHLLNTTVSWLTTARYIALQRQELVLEQHMVQKHLPQPSNTVTRLQYLSISLLEILCLVMLGVNPQTFQRQAGPRVYAELVQSCPQLDVCTRVIHQMITDKDVVVISVCVIIQKYEVPLARSTIIA